jgi:hypothetical protein
MWHLSYYSRTHSTINLADKQLTIYLPADLGSNIEETKCIAKDADAIAE